MRRLQTTMLFVVFIGFIMTVPPASADLTSNLIVGGIFEPPSYTGISSSMPLSPGIWHTTQTGGTNDWAGGNSALLWSSTGGGKTGTLTQAVYEPTASYGPVELKFAYDVPITIINGTAQLYGSNAQPIYGSYGTQIGTTINLTGRSGWQYVNATFGGSSFSGYDWYTVVFYGNLPENDKLYIDTVSLKVTEGTPVPLPGAVWLLSSALVGMAGIRRFRKK